MQYYHVYIRHIDSSGNQAEAIELDLSENEIKALIVEPYLRGQDFICGGQPINPFKVKEIRISQSEEPSEDIIPRLDRDLYLTIEDFGVVDNCPNVTKKFILYPPRKDAKSEYKKTVKTELSKDIFIVHGREHKPMRELKALLIELGFNPIVLHEQASGGSLTLVEKLEKYARGVGYAFVILTPEDVGGHKDEMKKKLGASEPWFKRPVVSMGANIMGDVLEDFEPRARQNVIFEMGYFFALLGRKNVCCLLKGKMEKPTDIDGVEYGHFDASINEVKGKIIKELREAGYEIKSSL
jgi:predicted nucleotide-binding protein